MNFAIYCLRQLTWALAAMGAWHPYFSIKQSQAGVMGWPNPWENLANSNSLTLTVSPAGQTNKASLPLRQCLNVRRYCGGATVRWLLDIIINRGSSWKAEMPGELSLGGETSLLGRDDASQLTEVRSFSLNSHLLLTVFLYMTLCDFSRLQ